MLLLVLVTLAGLLILRLLVLWLLVLLLLLLLLLLLKEGIEICPCHRHRLCWLFIHAIIKHQLLWFSLSQSLLAYPTQIHRLMNEHESTAPAAFAVVSIRALEMGLLLDDKDLMVVSVGLPGDAHEAKEPSDTTGDDDPRDRRYEPPFNTLSNGAGWLDPCVYDGPETTNRVDDSADDAEDRVDVFARHLPPGYGSRSFALGVVIVCCSWWPSEAQDQNADTQECSKEGVDGICTQARKKGVGIIGSHSPRRKDEDDT